MSHLEKILALPKVTHNLVQGSPPWDQFRLEHRGASEAAAMLSLSKNLKRNELLHMKHTGHAREFSEWLQRNVLDKGHELEAKAMPHIEKIVGDDLYPVTCSRGLISASCDGLTMDDRIAVEHKQWNEGLAAMVEAGVLPDEHWPQCQQVLMVTGAEKLYFVVSDGTPDQMVYVIVLPERNKWEALADGWAQFDTDLACYVVPEVREPVPVAEKLQALPALVLDVRGEVISDNLEVWKEAAISRIEQVNTNLVGDKDFEDAREAMKWCKESVDLLKVTKAAALGKMTTVEAVFSAVDKVIATFDAKRINLDNLITKRNDARKKEIVDAGANALNDHIEAKEQALLDLLPEGTQVKVRLMPPIPSDFWGVIKGKRSFANMESARDDEVARCKVTTNRAFELRAGNLRVLQEKAKDHKHLFADWRELIAKDAELVELQISQRIQAEREAEEKRLAGERERIRLQEEAKVRSEQEKRDAQARQEREAEERRQFEENRRHAEEVTRTAQPIVPTAASAAAPGPAVIPMPTKAPAAPNSPPTLRLGDIQKAFAPMSITAEGLALLGFHHAGTQGASKLYHHADFPRMRQAISTHALGAQLPQQQAA